MQIDQVASWLPARRCDDGICQSDTFVVKDLQQSVQLFLMLRNSTLDILGRNKAGVRDRHSGMTQYIVKENVEFDVDVVIDSDPCVSP